MAANAEECSRNINQPCNASALYAASEGAYLAASTSNLTLGLCIHSVRNGNGMSTITYKFENWTQAYEDTEQSVFTDVPDEVNITFGSDPNTIYQVTVPYGDYEACFVGKFETEILGCRLMIFDNATSDQITECIEGFSEACPGTVYDTWNETLCS